MLLGTKFVGSNIGAVLDLAVLDETVEPEFCAIPHYGERLLEELNVLSVAPVCPQVAGVPNVGNEIVVAPCAHAIVE